MIGPESLLAEGISSPDALLSAIVVSALLLFYGWLAIKSSARAVLTTLSFGITDAFCTGILGLWMILVIIQSVHARQVITLQAILESSILYGALVLGIFGVIGFQRLSPIGLFQLQPSRFPKAASTGLLWLAIIYPLILAIQWAVQCFSGAGDDAQLIVRYFLEHSDLKSRISVIFMAILVAPIAEEIIFRGYFYGVIRRYGGRIPAILISSLLFAAVHGNLSAAPGLCILAVTLCLLYERTGSLWASMTLHAAFNASTVVALIFWPGLATS
jgi:membrane protease YdiL (CAAX protease family)